MMQKTETLQVETDLNISNKYQKKTDKQHILDAPDTYIDSVAMSDATDMWVYDDDLKKIVEKKILYIPALLKLFDECIVNARDHVVRMDQAIINKEENIIPVSYIYVSISEDGTITITNDGNGIDIIEHPEHKLWIPEMIFGHLRTSTNYNKNEQKITGGKNGFGVKLIFIWSTYGEIETVDSVRKLKYKQTFMNNLNEINKPKITACSNKPYTKVIFKPDYKRLGISNLTPDIISLLKKRTYDISGVTNKKIKVKYNNEIIPIKTFKQYIELYLNSHLPKTEQVFNIGGGEEKNDVGECGSVDEGIDVDVDDLQSTTNTDSTSNKKKINEQQPLVYEEFSDRWEYAVTLTTTGEFKQVSFVNGICTINGGKHVEYILEQITLKIVALIEKKKKIKVTTNSIKEQLFLFVRCDIENPSFDSQSKKCLTTARSLFGSKCVVSDKFIEKVMKLGVANMAISINQIKENKTIANKTDGSKTKSIYGIPKLDDANFAGTAKSKLCTLILCEGDSAKAGISSGLEKKDRDTIGVYPLKGKVMNIRGKSSAKISTNKEITELKKIIGLQNGKVYNTIEDVHKNLRYGRIMILTDSDFDGSHIKGLIINLFHSEWCSLINIPDFISFMNTPILKARQNKKELLFYNIDEYEKWKETEDSSKWTLKYYKGLGTSTGKEFKEYFRNKKIVYFKSGKDCGDIIDMVFNDKRANDRKEWLKNVYNRKNYLNTNTERITYKEFINKELIHFSKYDCDRSIPNMVDGLKISQRKILFCGFKRNLVNEIKVAQFSGYVSEHSNYHHGEASLNSAIIGMAQNFVGANNINLFMPNGTFGTRIAGGQDSGSERYIYTELNPITKKIFNPYDNNVLEYINDDGTLVEPIYYIPIIPMILVNGCRGIGTGFSTMISCYNPLDIVKYLKNKINNSMPLTKQIFIPYYRGFTGSIIPEDDKYKRFIIKGVYNIIDNDKVKITELPVGLWRNDFKELLEKLRSNTDKDGKKVVPIVKEYKCNSDDVTIDITITFQDSKVQELVNTKTHIEGCNGLEKLLELYKIENTTNMHLFNENEKLHLYSSVEEIIDEFYNVRIKYYHKRKEYLINELEKTIVILFNKVKYIENILNGTIDLRNKTHEEIDQMLENTGIFRHNDSYDYLTNLSFKSVSKENVEKLNNDYHKKTQELKIIKEKSIEQIWLEELNEFEKSYN